MCGNNGLVLTSQCLRLQRDWDIKNGSIYFRKVSEEAISKDIPSHQLMTQTLGYARELERIV